MIDNELVVLLHGLGRGPRIMRKLAKKLFQAGYTVINISHPYRKHPIEELTKIIYQRVESACKQAKKVHFVGFSMGALITHWLIANYAPQNLARVVMIAPPAKGSEVAEFLQKFKFYQRLYGPAGQQLGTGEKGFWRKLPAINFDCGVIAGDRTIDWLFSWFLIPGEDDGKVSVASTKIAGIKDHLVVHANHASIPLRDITCQQVLNFLAEGEFIH